MILLQKNPLPPECQSCLEPECWECDLAGARWELSERDRLLSSRKLKEMAIARFQREISEIDRQLAALGEAQPPGK